MEGKRLRTVLRSLVFLTVLVSAPFFAKHYLWFITGRVSELVVKGEWSIVLVNVVGFLAFLIPLHYRRKADWKSLGIYSAFIVSLFVEMYGIPLTIYLSSSMIGGGYSGTQNFLLTMDLLGVELGMTLWMVVGGIVTLAGVLLIGIGWHRIYRSDEELVTSGVYSISRHPQYLGIIMLAVGWFIGWPSLLTTMILPVLIYNYYKLSLEEEEEVMEELSKPEKYEEYREKVPLLF